MIPGSAIQIDGAWHSIATEIGHYLIFILLPPLGLVLGLALAVVCVFWLGWKVIAAIGWGAGRFGGGGASTTKEIVIKAAPSVVAHAAKRGIDHYTK